MAITLEAFEKKYPDRAKPIPAEFAGQWIAWNTSRSKIVAHGPELSQVRSAAVASGHPEPVLQKIPRGPFVGGDP